tara:strand:+ start:8482 stop:9492 length:1011 start_codon:yes stop_codon:yes gene_type:complete
MNVLKKYFSKRRDSAQLYTDALESLLKHDQRDAFLKLRELVKNNTDRIEAYIKLADILRETDKQDRAAKIHKSLLTRPKLSPEIKEEILTSLAKDYEALKLYDLAEENAGEILRLNKKNRWASEFLVAVSEKNKKWAKADEYLKYFEKIAGKTENEKRAKYLMHQGLDAENAGNPKEAKTKYQKASQVNGSLGDPFLRLAELNEKEGDLANAIENWKKFIKISPDSSREVFSKIEKALYKLGRFTEVENLYSELIEEHPDNVAVLTSYINVLTAKGEVDRALRLIEDALVKNEESVLAHLTKLKLQLKKHNQDDLSGGIDKIIELVDNPESSAETL